MSKQTVTGVAEGHLLHKDFLVEYDPDERTWTVEREVPAESTPEPGTAGTATVSGWKGMRVMRVDYGPGVRTGDDVPVVWVSDVPIEDCTTHGERDVTDFVPDPKPGVIPDDLANAIAENWRARLDDATSEAARMKALADSQTDIATKALDDRDAAEERARLAERDARAEHAEVERLRAKLDDQWPFKPGDIVHSNGPTADAEWLDVAPGGTQVKDAAGTVWTVGGTGKYWCDSPGGRHLRSTALLDGFGRVTVVSVPGAPEPRPAFVLPDLYALTMAIADDSPLHLPVERREQFKAVAERVQALLAEHAVTEEKLRDAITRVHREGGNLMSGEYERRILDHLRGER